MRAESIKREVARLKSKYKTSDAEELCEAMGIRVSRQPMAVMLGHVRASF